MTGSRCDIRGCVEAILEEEPEGQAGLVGSPTTASVPVLPQSSGSSVDSRFISASTPLSRGKHLPNASQLQVQPQV